MQENNYQGMSEGIGLPRGVSGVYRPETNGQTPKTYRDVAYQMTKNLGGNHSDPKKTARELADPGSVLKTHYGDKPNSAA